MTNPFHCLLRIVFLILAYVCCVRCCTPLALYPNGFPVFSCRIHHCSLLLRLFNQSMSDSPSFLGTNSAHMTDSFVIPICCITSSTGISHLSYLDICSLPSFQCF